MQKRCIQLGVTAVTLTFFLIFSSCRKNGDEFNGSPGIDTKSHALSQEEITSLLDDFWANYAVYKNVEITSTITPDLQAVVPGETVANTLHYALNTAAVTLDSTWEDVQEDSFTYMMEANSNSLYSKELLCSTIDGIMSQIRDGVANSSVEMNALRSVEVQLLSEENNTLTMQVKYIATGGALASTRNGSEGVNVSTTYFPTTLTVPWVSTQTAPTPIQTLPLRDKYWTWLMSGHDYSQNPTTLTQAQSAYGMLPDAKPAHLYLTANTLFWPNGGSPNFGFWTVDYTPVPGNQLWELSASNYVACQDLPDCNNPLAPASNSITPTSANLVPSRILGWFDTEHHYNLSQIRTISGSTLNYFWANRHQAAIAGYNKLSTTINQWLSTRSGFAALTILDYKVHNWTLPGHASTVCTYTNCGDICDHLAEYKVYCRFQHYTLQKKAPLPLRSFFSTHIQ